MLMWNRELYIAMIHQIVKNGSFMGECIGSKEDFYKCICSKLHVSYNTVKSWCRKDRNGPGDEDVLSDLEEMLGVKLTKENKQEAVKEEIDVEGKKYSNFIKKSVKMAYDLMYDYVNGEDIENENTYCKMRSDLRKLRISIPRKIYEKIEEFADKNLEPIIYDDTYWDFMKKDELGYIDENGSFHLKNEEATFEYMGMFLTKTIEIGDALEEFGMKELYPVLTAAE